MNRHINAYMDLDVAILLLSDVNFARRRRHDLYGSHMVGFCPANYGHS